MTKAFEQWTITTYVLAGGMYRYQATKPGRKMLSGIIEAQDTYHAYDLVVAFIKYITPVERVS